MKEKFLLFQNAANDCMVYPLSKLKSCEGKNGSVELIFDTIAGEDTLSLTTSDEFQALKDIAEAIGGNNVQSDGVIVMADDVNSVYVSSQITAVGAAA
tara:strand:+ start:209 stop:502 length:294 start_codon:yes stop_codon:yes gene_type:complete